VHQATALPDLLRVPDRRDHAVSHGRRPDRHLSVELKSSSRDIDGGAHAELNVRGA
jgi:hypothetical protein